MAGRDRRPCLCSGLCAHDVLCPEFAQACSASSAPGSAARAPCPCPRGRPTQTALCSGMPSPCLHVGSALQLRPTASLLREAFSRDAGISHQKSPGSPASGAELLTGSPPLVALHPSLQASYPIPVLVLWARACGSRPHSLCGRVAGVPVWPVSPCVETWGPGALAPGLCTCLSGLSALRAGPPPTRTWHPVGSLRSTRGESPLPGKGSGGGGRVCPMCQPDVA